MIWGEGKVTGGKGLGNSSSYGVLTSFWKAFLSLWNQDRNLGCPPAWGFHGVTDSQDAPTRDLYCILLPSIQFFILKKDLDDEKFENWEVSNWGFLGSLDSKEFACNVGGLGSIPGSERLPGEGNSNPLQYSCLGNPMDREAWWVIRLNNNNNIGYIQEMEWVSLQ